MNQAGDVTAPNRYKFLDLEEAAALHAYPASRRRLFAAG